LASLHNERNHVRIENHAFDELEILPTDGGVEILEIGPIIKDAKANKVNVEMLLGHEIAHVGVDEAATTVD
jgi:hypothetical protein